MANTFLVVLYASAFFKICRCVDEFNPYTILNVPKSADSLEIRKSYKLLVKKWHPDKNDASIAQDKFIQIQQAYEILSDDEKRRQYDIQGFSQGSNNNEWHQQQPFQYSEYFSSDFDFSNTQQSLSEQDFYNAILPNSYTTPQVIYVYSTFCVQCIITLKTSWKKASKDLEKLGIGISTVDATFSSRLALILHVSRVPTTVVIYEEKKFYYRGLISYQNLKTFVNAQLPSNHITLVNSENFKEFLYQVQWNDKPRALLFSVHPKPTLLYTLMSIKHQQYIEFGYFPLLSSDSNEISEKYNIGKGPCLLLFKEDVNRPVITLQSSDMPRGAVDDLLESNHYMTVARLTSQSVFDDLCPPKQNNKLNLQLCAIFCINELSQINALRSLVVAAIADDEQLTRWISFVYFNPDSQPEFRQSLFRKLETTDNTQVFLIHRQEYDKGLLTARSAEFLKNENTKEYEFHRILALGLRTKQQLQFDHQVEFVKLRNELTPNAFMVVLLSAYSHIRVLTSVLSKMSDQEFMLLIVTSVVCLLSIFSFFSKTPQQKKPSNNNVADIHQDTSCDEDVEVHVSYDDDHDQTAERNQNNSTMSNLTPSNYTEMILRQNRGHMTIVFLKQDSNEMQQEFMDVMQVHLRNPKFHVATLDISVFYTWYLELRRTSSAQPPSNTDDLPPNKGLSTLHSDNKSLQEADLTKSLNVCVHGTVLAINGSKHWYCIFVPRQCRSVDFTKQLKSQTTGMRATSLHHESPFDEVSGSLGSSDVIVAPFSRSEYGNSLMLWMDRVCEGQMPRLYVRQWPGLYIRNAESDN